MECAGNDRVAMRPLPAGEPWRTGAVSTAEWTGVPLADLLDAAGLRAEAVEVLAAGADAGPRADAAAPGPVRFARSLPRCCPTRWSPSR
jgi:DMSO/TMAO reductase YedYZ molybdopterin-dependent catalytic subunit